MSYTGKIITLLILTIFFSSCDPKKETIIPAENNIDNSTVNINDEKKYPKFNVLEKFTINDKLFILDKVDKGDPEFEQYVYKTVSDRLSLVTVKKYINNTFFYADINYNKVTTELKDLDTFYNAQKSGMDVVLKMFGNIDLKDELKGKVNMDDFGLVYEESFKQYGYEDTYILPTMYQYSYYHYDGTYYYRITYSNNGNTLTKDILPENRAKEFTNILTPLRGKLHTLFTEK